MQQKGFRLQQNTTWAEQQATSAADPLTTKETKVHEGDQFWKSFV
jgi:hypothetical protein